MEIKKYEIKKTVRFNILGENDTLENIEKLGLKKDYKVDDKYKLLEKFIKKYEEFINLNYEIFFSDKKTYFRNKLSVNYKFLDIYLKQEYYSSGKRKENADKKREGKNIKIIDKGYDFLRKFLIDIFIKNSEGFAQLKEYSFKPENEKNRFSEINFLLQKLNSQYISVFKNLYENLKQTNDKKIDDKINEQKAEIIQISQDILVLLGEFGINNGIEIAKGSFNYFTLNKSSKEYFENEIIDQKNKLNKKFHNIPVFYKLGVDFYKNMGINPYDLENKTIKEIYDFIKIFKAKRKSAFIQFVSNGYSKNDLKDNEKSIYKYRENGELVEEELSVELFQDIGENFDDFKNICFEIKEIGNKLGKIYQKYDVNKDGLLKLIDSKDSKLELDDITEFEKLIDEKEKKSQERGKYFNKPSKNEIIYTKNYKYLCDFYKNIALKYGEIKAKLAGFEKQKIEAEKLRYFGIIIEKENNKYLGLIPKETGKHKSAYELLKTKQEKSGEIKIYYFESLTLRALQKLCFKEEKNTFIRHKDNNIENELNTKYFHKDKYGNLVLKRFDEFKNGEKIDEGGLIEFYQDVLQTQSAQRMLHLEKFSFNKTDIFSEKFKSLQEFEIALEKYAYKKVEVCFSENEYQDFLKNNEVFEYEISSQDLQLNRQDKNKNKNHTNYWFEFWTDDNIEKNYDVRINPEFSIYFRVGDENLKDKFDKGLLPEPKKLEKFRHRNIKDKLTFVSNITLNSNEKSINLAYKQDDDIRKNIEKFNSDIESKIDKNNTWYFGIDRGLNELATLSVVKFLDDSAKNFEFAKIKTYKIKEKYSKIKEIKIDEETGNLMYFFETIDFPHKDGEKRKNDVQPAKNISYFINDGKYEDLFEDDEVGNIDLTQAKLFGDKIVVNSDIMTHLRLKELAAKRAIFELYSQGDINKSDVIELGGKGTLKIKNKSIETKSIYWSITELKDNNEFKNIIVKYLNNYLQSINLSEGENIDTVIKINHLRDSLASNLVGILFYLYKELGSNGKIIFENTDQKLDNSGLKIIESHFLQSNEYVERRYELSIYNKFQLLGIVPPNLTKSVLLKDMYDINKYGLVNFIHTGKTSSICPVCGENLGSKSKLQEHLFTDKGHCYSKLNSELKNDKECDKIAAFTVAKFGFKNIFNEKNLEHNYSKTKAVLQNTGVEFKRSK